LDVPPGERGGGEFVADTVLADIKVRRGALYILWPVILPQGTEVCSKGFVYFKQTLDYCTFCWCKLRIGNGRSSENMVII